MNCKYFSVNKDGCSIRCKLFYTDLYFIDQVVLYAHGFGGNKENKAAERFASKALSKHKNVGVLAFDWPCHGEDGRKKIDLADCDKYLSLVIEHAKNAVGAHTLFAYATSFGGYLVLKFISEHMNPFCRIALRSAAVNMFDVMKDDLVSEKEWSVLEKGKDVLVGFDRKIRISKAFMDSLKEADITKRSFVDENSTILTIHGTKDEVVPIEPVRSFAMENHIRFISVENADHRFVDSKRMDEATNAVVQFFWPM